MTAPYRGRGRVRVYRLKGGALLLDDGSQSGRTMSLETPAQGIDAREYARILRSQATGLDGEPAAAVEDLVRTARDLLIAIPDKGAPPDIVVAIAAMQHAMERVVDAHGIELPFEERIR